MTLPTLSEFSHRDALNRLKRLRRRLSKDDASTLDLNSIDRALSVMGEMVGQTGNGMMKVWLSAADLAELLALLRDDDGEADEDRIDDLIERFAAAERGLLSRLDEMAGAA